jgi:Rieske Fe-S protein
LVEKNLTSDTGRRQFLAAGFRVTAACLCLPLLDLVSGCSQEESAQASEPLTVPLAMVPMGGRTRLDNGGRPVELQRTETGITARSLLCTHQGCKVSWHEDKQLYICPCHEGKYDANGEVVYGMPRKPLSVLAVTVKDGQVIVGG